MEDAEATFGPYDRHCANGPAQNTVKAATRTPASGRSARARTDETDLAARAPSRRGPTMVSAGGIGDPGITARSSSPLGRSQKSREVNCGFVRRSGNVAV